jgi:hypothetical protein
MDRRAYLSGMSLSCVGAMLGGKAKLVRGQGYDAVRETEHFVCRLAPKSPYIDSQRDNKAFAFDKGRIYLSDDNSKSWGYSCDFAEAKNITFSCILSNGNVLFATRERLYLSRDNLKSYNEVIVKKQDGTPYLPHVPKDPDNPGWYFHPLDGIHTWDIDGREMLVWGNYCNVIGGHVPINIYYSTDQGETVKIAYSFGQNPKFQENGIPREEFLGDAANPLICRHVHCVTFNPVEKAFYACTGDLERGFGKECHWLRGAYDLNHDRWTWKVLTSVDANSRYKTGGMQFWDGKCYLIADANGPKRNDEVYDRGIFRCSPEDITLPSKHEKLFDPTYELAAMIIDKGVILSAHNPLASPYKTGIIISPDLGKTWAQYDLAEYGDRSPFRFHPSNSEGWLRVDLRDKWINRAEVLFIKPKA